MLSSNVIISFLFIYYHLSFVNCYPSNVIRERRHNIETKVENIQLNDVTFYVETTTEQLTTPKPLLLTPIPGNDLYVGACQPQDKKIYVDNTIITNEGPSTLNGTLEIYLDAPYRITCFHVIDQIEDGTGAIPSLNSGGVGYDWVKVDVVGKYGKGFHFKIHIFGTPFNKTITTNEI